jgi:hypothetical protein
MMRYYEYCGMSYETASREAERLSKYWYKNFDRLRALKEIMDRGFQS